MNKEINYEEVIKKIEELKKGKKFDLSTEEDLAIAVMNLISLEEHFFFTATKTNNTSFKVLFRAFLFIAKFFKKFIIIP